MNERNVRRNLKGKKTNVGTFEISITNSFSAHPAFSYVNAKVAYFKYGLWRKRETECYWIPRPRYGFSLFTRFRINNNYTLSLIIFLCTVRTWNMHTQNRVPLKFVNIDTWDYLNLDSWPSGPRGYAHKEDGYII